MSSTAAVAVPAGFFGAPALSTGSVSRVIQAPRCSECNRRLAGYLTPPFSIKCPKCHAENARE